MSKFINQSALTFFISLLGSQVFAATLPGSAQPQQVGQALLDRAPSPALIDYAAPAVAATPANVDLSEENKRIRFKLNDIDIIGAQVFSKEQLRSLYSNELHHVITLNDLLLIVQRITNYYRSHGYISSQAVLLPQQAKNGVVRIKMIEGYVDKVSIVGEPGKAAPVLLAYGNKITQYRPLEMSRLEKYLLLANEVPGSQVKGILVPSKNKLGASDLVLLTDHKTITGYLTYDNYGTRYIGPQQITGNLGLNSFFRAGDSTQLTLAKTTKGRELLLADLNYGLPVSSEGSRLLVGATRVNTHPLFVLAPSDIDGVNSNYYGTLIFPQIRSQTQNLSYLLGFNYNNTRVTTFDVKLYEDHLRSLGAGVMYDFEDRIKGLNSLYVDIRQGLGILGATTDTNRSTAQTSRPGGNAIYTKFDLSLSHTQPITDPISLYGLIKGQYSFQPLLTAEQFSYGGSQLGRGYDIAELLGDKAIAASVEARFNWRADKKYLSNMEFYAFYDIGKAWNFFAAPGLPGNYSAASTGGGIRFVFTDHISGNLLIAKPLTKVVATQALLGDPGHAARGLFSITANI